METVKVRPRSEADQILDRKWLHRQKMERKELDRYERGSRRTMEYERLKADAHRIVLKMRVWLKSPYAFRRGGPVQWVTGAALDTLLDEALGPVAPR